MHSLPLSSVAVSGQGHRRRAFLVQCSMALAALDGYAATTAILSHYDAIPDESRPLVLRAIGTQAATEAVALVVRELQNPDVRYRRAALDAATHEA